MEYTPSLLGLLCAGYGLRIGFGLGLGLVLVLRGIRRFTVYMESFTVTSTSPAHPFAQGAKQPGLGAKYPGDELSKVEKRP